MYLLKIVNTLKERDDLFVYDDDDVNFASIVRSFTKEALDSIIKATLNQDLPLTDKTFRKCAHIVELLTEDKFAEANVWEFLQIVCMAPDDIPDEVEELEICSQESSFVPCGEPFVEHGLSEKFGEFTFHTMWVVYDTHTYGYELFFQGPNHTIDIELTYKDGFDTPPIVDDEPFYYY